ncbi:MAG: hypothetical protein KJZ86_18345 [Caldilineaceae bacterium]|nr:hypothetical protein [Caldilineaceae bacterium]HRJ40632.1 hypothetical protein [Caldilineaceae bacterium]
MNEQFDSKRRLSRRTFLIAGSSAALAVALAACAPPAAAPASSGAAESAASEAAAPAAEAEEISFLVRTDIRNAYAADAAAESWSQEFPDRKLILDEPAAGTAVNTKVQAAQAAGDLIWDGYAVIALPWDTATWVKQGLIQSLDDYIAASMIPNADDVIAGIIPTVLESTKAEGKQYAIPGNVGSVALGWYNEFLDEAGVDRPLLTWDDVRVAAEKVHAQHPEINAFDRPNTPLTDLVGMIWGATDTPYTNEGLIDWSGEASLAAIEWMQGMVADGLMPAVNAGFGTWLQKGTAIMSSFDVHGTLAQQSHGDGAADTGINMRRVAAEARAGAPFWLNGCVVLDKANNPQGMTDFFLWWFSPQNKAMGKQVADVAAKPAYQYTYDEFIKDVPKHAWQLEGIDLVRNSVPFQANLTWGIETAAVKTWLEKALDPANDLSAADAMASAQEEIQAEIDEML